MNKDRWQIVKDQVSLFWSTLGVKRQQIPKLYPLRFEKLKLMLQNANKIHLVVEECPILTSAAVEGILRKRALLTSEERQSENGETQLAGALYAIGDTGVIFVPGADPESRKLFSLAHELGHFFIEIFVPFKGTDDLERKRLFNRDVVGTVTRTADGNLTEASFVEFKANQFAAELLMPRQMVLAITAKMRKGKKRKISGEVLTNRIVKKCGVSRKAAEYRILDLGIRAT